MNETPKNFTPVTKENFEEWCKIYMERINKIKEENLTEKDFKPTGKEIFMKSKGMKDFVLEIDEEGEEFKDDDNEI